jgi:SH3-like domain-containing protein
MALQIFATGATVTTSAVSAGATIPLSSAGSVPRFVRISCSASAHVRIGTGAQTAVNTDLLVVPSDAVIIATGGCTHFAAIQQAAAGVVQVSPVEDI